MSGRIARAKTVASLHLEGCEENKVKLKMDDEALWVDDAGLYSVFRPVG